MNYTPQQAFDQIKALETQGVIPSPAATATIHVGAFNVQTGKFAYSIPTANIVWFENLGRGPNGKPIPPLKHTTTVGKIGVNAVDLILTFSVSPANSTFTVQVGSKTVSINTPPVLQPKGVIATTLHSLTIDLGSFVSTPRVAGEEPGILVNMWSGSVSASIRLDIERPPLVSAGAFNIPALPIALVYAPPPGAQNRNYAEYSTSSSISTKVSTSFSSGTSDKTADAYTKVDFLGKTSSIVAGIQGLIVAFDETAAFVKQLGGAITLGLNVLSGFIDDTTTSTTDISTAANGHDLITTDSDTSTIGTPVGLGPGVGDKFVYLRNVKVAWVIANGQISYTVLGHDGIRGFPAQVLVADLGAISSSSGTVTSGPVTSLDEVSLHTLLSLDPFINNPSPFLPSPRFVPNDPPSASGNGTDPNGDFFIVKHDVSTVDTATQTTSSVKITDFKPGWLNALFGDQADHQEDTLIFTSAVQTTTDQQVSATVHFFAGPNDPPYIVGLSFDRMFGTFVFTQAQE
jgi:hypothetical protein